MSPRSTPTRSKAAAVLVGGALATTTIFVTAQERPNTQSPTVRPAVVLTGCLEESSDTADVFLLRVAPPTTAGTSAAAGTSATGDAPSGQVTGQTPTGATATSTATPTPSVGTPEATANPASPTYNRPSDTSGGSVSAADTSAQSGVTLYRLEAAPGVPVGEHIGRLVEVRGTLQAARNGSEACCAGLQGPTAHAHEPEAKQPRTGTTGTSGSAHPTTSATRLPTIAVTSVTRLGPTCAR